MTGRRKLIIGILVILAVVAAVVYSVFWWEGRQPKDLLRLQGHMEATETDLSFKVSGIIEYVFFQEGDWVSTGQKAAGLEAKDLQDEVDRARADMQAAKANLTKLTTGYRSQEIKEAEAQVGKAKADLDNKKIEYERYENLLSRQVVAAQTRDKFLSDYLQAKEAFKNAQEELSLRKEGYRVEDINQAREQYKAAVASLELAQTRLGYATISSPVNGVVLVRPMEPGMTAAVGSPVLTLGDMDNIYFEGYIPETDLAKVKFGMKAEITTDAYPGKKYPAWVSFINSKAEFTPKTVETYKERVTLVYRTKIRAQNLNYDLKPGMPAEAVIFLDSQPDQQFPK
ncbi:MAG: efflux RND transporter periplasmic adaptor subunit [Deltaproteobacteria bacterium]|nr:efflux RND transporter periplasmic adaptor subunit [Deltaproteobacteria bacterium]